MGVMEEILAELKNLNEKIDDLAVGGGTNTETQMLSVEEAADFLKLSKTKVYEMIRQKEIPYTPMGRRKLISKVVLLDWIQENTYLGDVVS